MRPTDTLDARPLIREIERSGVLLDKGPKRAWHRAKERGYISPEAADQLAIGSLGMHPCEIWPDWFEVMP